MTRAVPNAFASLTNPTLPNLDADFAALTPASILPCVAAGTNLITLTPQAATLSVSAYTDKELYSFNANATSTGVVTLQVGALAALKVFTSGGTTQATTGDIVSGAYYVVAYQAALDTGAGGFVVVSATSSTTYVEGSWTPVLQGSSVAGANTYGVQFGRYIRTGNLIWVSGRITLTAKDSTMAGTAQIAGFPFTATAGVNLSPQFAVNYTAITLSATSFFQVSVGMRASNTSADILESGSGVGLQVAGIPVTGFVSTSDIIFSGSYRTG